MKKLGRIISLILLLFIPFFAKATTYIEREIVPREELKIYETPESTKVVKVAKVGEKLIFTKTEKDRVYIKDKGWMDIKDKEYLVKSLDTFIVYKKMKLTCGVVPANTLIEKPYARDLKEEKIIVEFEGCTELVPKENGYMANLNIDYYVLLEKQYKLYEEGSTSSDVLISIPKKAIINIKAYVEQDNNEVLLYTEYKNKKGWLVVQSNKIKVFENEKSAVKYRKNSAIIKIVLDTVIIIVLVIILIVRSKKRNEKNS